MQIKISIGLNLTMLHLLYLSFQWLHVKIFLIFYFNISPPLNVQRRQIGEFYGNINKL